MADKRKLQAEIDRCLKTVGERVEIFQEIFDKVHSASNSNLKEKYEGDLKKEIKKLQRLRDQIKTWLAGSEVKTQRSVLTDNRRLIEVQMERFKVIERETKTKAFSKEGLAAAAKASPRDQERNEVRDWLNDCVGELDEQIEQYERDMEETSSSKKKKNKNNDKENQLQERIDRHRYHIDKMGMLMKLIGNDSTTDLDKQIKETLEEDIRYYIDENTDVDFQENEYMYEDFDKLIEESEEQNKNQAENNGVGAAELLAQKEREIEAAQKKQEEEQKRKAKEKEEKEREKEKEREVERERRKEEEREREKVKKKAEKEKADAAAAVAAAREREKPLSPPQTKLKINFAAVAGSPATNGTVPKSAMTPGPMPNPMPTLVSGSWNEPLNVQRSPKMPDTVPTLAKAPSLSTPTPITPPTPTPPPTTTNAPTVATPPTSITTPPSTIADVAGAPADISLNLNLQLLLMSSMNLPEPQEPQTGFKAPNPYNVPAWYPTKPPQHFSEPSFFASLEVDTLFFIFYHQQGTYQQYLAARELKKQAWRFHKKYLTWFQRFEEPKVITDEFEQGTYVYFDFEAGWCQRKKTDFTFEYRFLEDQELA